MSKQATLTIGDKDFPLNILAGMKMSTPSISAPFEKKVNSLPLTMAMAILDLVRVILLSLMGTKVS